MGASSLAISSSVKKTPPIPRAFLSRLKNTILGKRYELSFAFLSRGAMRRLNRVYRGKDRPTDILAFPLSKTSGELILCPAEAKRRARALRHTYRNCLRFLVIHGLLHLKGMRHGSRMEAYEKKFRRKFSI